MRPAIARLESDEMPMFSVAIDSWSKRHAESGHGALPNLGVGGTLVTVFVSSYFAAQISNALLIIVFYGWQTYFVRGIRVTDWKHGVASNGAIVPFTGLATFIFWILLIVCVEIAAGYLTAFLRDRPHLLTAVAKLLGGSALMIFSVFLLRHGSFFIHPIPLGALIGGATLIWGGLRSLWTILMADRAND
jgi:hypothetical protein